jgi:DNA-binding protein Fis
MRRTNGNKTNAAKLLAITRQGLDKKIKRHNLQF